MNKKIGSNPMKVVLVLCALLLIGYGTIHLIHDVLAYREANQEYQEIASSYTKDASDSSDEADTEASSTDSDGENGNLLIDWEGLKQVNTDLSFWLLYQDKDSDINISMPVVQATADEPDRYLNTTFEGKSNPSGCVFVNADADLEKDSNVFLYGHNMRNGTMFGNLKRLYQYPDKVTNTTFQLYFPDGTVKRYEILSVVRTTNSSDLYFVPANQSELKEYIGKLRQNSLFPSTEKSDALVKAAESSQESVSLVTLSTCDGYAGTSRRLLVTGILMKTEYSK